MDPEYLIGLFKQIQIQSMNSSAEPFDSEIVARNQEIWWNLSCCAFYPRNWTFSYARNNELCYRLNTLEQASSEYEEVASMFRMTCKSKKITKIDRVENPWLYAQFHLNSMKKRDVFGHVTTRTLFHGTKSCNIDSICKNNFNWRLVGRSGYLGCKYGRGVAFSPKASYAADYPRRHHESPRVMFIVKVLEVNSCNGSVGMLIPPTSIYDTSIRPNGDVVVKYSDNEFYPEYIIYYSH